jgi:hypothetical protein
VDATLNRLRGRVNRVLPNLIENIRGRGYRVSAMRDVARPVHANRNEPEATKGTLEVIDFTAMMQRFRLVEDGGILRPGGEVLVESSYPLELVGDYGNDIVRNVMRGGIEYRFLIPVSRSSVANELIQLLVSESNRVEPKKALTQNTVFLALSRNVRVVVVPGVCPASTYAANAHLQELTELYYCLSQERSALLIKRRDAAYLHAQELLSLMPEEPALLSIASEIAGADGVLRAMQTDLNERLRGVISGSDLLIWGKAGKVEHAQLLQQGQVS